jgi:tetratricopeptide (TPR) repeat protein
MGVSEELEKAQSLLDSGDIPGLLLHLRGHGEALPVGEMARLVAGAARLAGLDDLAQAAAAVAAAGTGGPGPEDVLALYNFGYACIELRIEYLAVPPLARALELAPDAAPVLSELVAALEQDGRHARAVAVLEEHESVMQWTHRYSYVYNALMAGSLAKAAAGFSRLPEPEDAAWIPAREKVRRMLARAEIALAVTPLDYLDLRGWHYVLTGGVLGRLSPYGFAAGMTGRFGWVGDSAAGCAAALQRLRLILDAAGAVPESVALLPDRSSRILGAAAAVTLGLPAADFDPGRPAAHSLVVAYDLTQTDPDAVADLRWRAPGQIVFERATCWTDPPRVTADISGLLGQSVASPWAGRPRIAEDGTVGRGLADDRPAEILAAEIVYATPEQDEGDGCTPPDPDEGLRRFVEAVAAAAPREHDGGWLGGLREWIPDPGPVPSNRFL